MDVIRQFHIAVIADGVWYFLYDRVRRPVHSVGWMYQQAYQN